MRLRKLLLVAATVAMVHGAAAQNKLLDSKQLMSYNLYPRLEISDVQFVGSGNQVAYVQDTVLYAGKMGAAKKVLTLSQLNQALEQAGEAPRTHLRGLTVGDKEDISLATGSHYVKYNLKSRKVTRVADISGAEDKDHVDVEAQQYHYAYTVDNNLYIYNGSTLTAVTDENPNIVYGQSVHRNEFGIEKGTFWSPKGNRLAFYRMDQTMVTDYPLVNTATRIATARPIKYPMAGMKSHEVTVGIYDCRSNAIRYLNTRKDTSVAERENYLTNLTWSPDEQYLYIAKVNRLQNHMWLERYNVTTGTLDKVLFEESHPRYVEPCEGLVFLPGDNSRFLWYSMRDGYKHLYLYNDQGVLLKQLTHGAYEVEGIIGFDAKGENLFIYANKDNLIGRAAYRVNLSTGAMTLLTPKEGTHTVSVSHDGSTWIDRYSTVHTPARCVVANSKQQVVLNQATNPLQDYAMPQITMGTIKAADGVTDLYYRLMTPPHMEPGKKYPTLVYVYGGPHSQLVTDSWLGGGNLYFLFLAQQGYVVFTVDNRGTDNRGFEFESCTHRRLGTVEMADQMEGVRFLQSLPYVDTERMGVEGWSFGGFMTITMKLAHPEVFKVGCAGGPVIDWKWYEVMYGERYMDMPQENPEGYAQNCLTAKAKDLQGHLLVIHGAEDNTVVWQHSLEFIDACIKAGRQVDYFVYPHHEHNVRGRDRIHLYEKMFNYYETFLK